MELIKTTPEEIGVPSFDIEQEAYKFATAKCLGKGGVRTFYSATHKLGPKAKLVDIRKEALKMAEAAKAITERIVNVKDAVSVVTAEGTIGATVITGIEPADPDDAYRGPGWGK